jgi:hypothetical protein
MRCLILGMSALALLTAAALPARACINDREVNRSEREFKSQYQQPAYTPTPAPPPAQDQGTSLAFLGAGTFLLLGAAATVLNLRKGPSPE